MKIVVVVIIIGLLQRSLGQVTLRLVNERACSGDDLTFSCERATKSGLLVWDITALTGLPTSVIDFFGQSLNATYERITSPDNALGPNPSIITIRNVTTEDNGATVQCRIVNMELSDVITLFIRPAICKMDFTVLNTTSSAITISWTVSACTGPTPTYRVQAVSMLSGVATVAQQVDSTVYEIPSLMAATAFNVQLVDAECPNIIIEHLQVLTDRNPIAPPTMQPSPTAALPNTVPSPRSDEIPFGVMINGMIFGQLLVVLIVMIIVFAVLVIKHKIKNKTHGENLMAHHGEEMVDVHGDTTYATPDKDKAAAEGGEGEYSYAATTTVIGAKHSKPEKKPDDEMKVVDDVSAHPEKPKRGSKKQFPPADVPHKQGPVGDLYAMPDKRAPEVERKPGPQGVLYAVAAWPPKSGYDAEGPN